VLETEAETETETEIDGADPEGALVWLLVAARDQGLAMPTAIVLFSPYADLTLTGDSMKTKAAVGPSFTADAH